MIQQTTLYTFKDDLLERLNTQGIWATINYFNTLPLHGTRISCYESLSLSFPPLSLKKGSLTLSIDEEKIDFEYRLNFFKKSQWKIVD